MAQITVEERLIALETKVDMMNSIMATKADLANLRWQLGGLIIAATGIIIAALRVWQ